MYLLPQAINPAAEAATLESRQLGGGGYRYRTRRRTPWSSWGRWVLAGILIFVGLLLLLVFLCISRRRRTKQRRLAATQAPMATHHSGGGGFFSRFGGPNRNNHHNNNVGGYNNGGYNNGYNNGYDSGAPPQYGGNNGYYGQQSGVSQPQGAYMK